MKLSLVLVSLIVSAACRPPYSPRTTPVEDDNTQSADVLEDQYADRGPPKLLVAPALDIQIFGPDSITVAAEVHGYVPNAVALTGYAGYGVFGNSQYRVEGYAGFPLFKSRGYTVGNWAISQTTDATSITTTYKRINLPVHSMLIVEGGLRVQGINFAELPMGSLPNSLDDDSFSGSTVGWIRAGFRRKTFWHAKVTGGNESARSMASWWLHAVVAPFGVPDPTMTGATIYYKGLFGNDEVASLPVGGAFGMEFPAWAASPILFRAEAAYLPGPHGLELMVGANYLFQAL